MSERFPGGIISKTAPVPTGPYETGTAPGIWTLDQQAEFVKQGIWPIAGLTPNYIEDVFSTWLYTGNGSTQTITNGIDLAGEGGLVWGKSRTAADDHKWYDTNRGVGKYLMSSATNAQITDATSLTAFNADGFSLGSSSANNFNGRVYASWTFRKQPKFFDVVTWSGDGTGNGRRLAHNLGSVPGCMIFKRTNITSNWSVWHRTFSNPTDDYLNLNLANGIASFTNNWGTSAPTATDFPAGYANGSGDTYVAYLFAHDAGGFGESGEDNVISCGSFTTDGSGNTALQDLGWEPQFLMTKVVSTTGNWLIQDSMRGFVSSTTGQRYLYPNLSNVESGATDGWQPTATGFQDVYASQGPGRTYIYIAIRRGPMKVPESGTEVFSPISTSATTGTQITTGFPVDTQMFYYPIGTNASNTTFQDRLRGVSSNSTDQYVTLVSSSTGAEGAVSGQSSLFWNNTGFQIPSYANGTSQLYLNFRRAPSVFDVVCYTGNSTAGLVVNHNLAVVPELVIFKKRAGSTGGWPVWTTSVGTGTSFNYLNTTSAVANQGVQIFTATPTSSAMTLGSWTGVNDSNTMVAYLFATCAGVSKVGSYTGTGTTQQINCGFTAGARFVLIKRTDSTGDWYVWDSARGIVAGDDPYLLLNSTAAEVTNTDYVDTYSAGFEITSTAPAAINASGGSFIFLAIA